MSPATLFVDLDGTVTDPGRGIIGAVRHALATLGVAVDPADDLRWVIGPPLHDTFRGLAGALNADRAIAFYRERYGGGGLYDADVVPGMPEALAALKGRGHRLLLATSKPHAFATPILTHFGLIHLFDAVYGSELDGTRAHKSELLAYMLEREGLKARSVVMIGDRLHDVIGAKANGVTSIGVLWGYGSRTELENAGADRICGDPSELQAVIDDPAAVS